MIKKQGECRSSAPETLKMTLEVVLWIFTLTKRAMLKKCVFLELQKETTDDPTLNSVKFILGQGLYIFYVVYRKCLSFCRIPKLICCKPDLTVLSAGATFAAFLKMLLVAVDDFFVPKIMFLNDRETNAQLIVFFNSRPPPVVLVGNKSDLHFARRVNREEGFELSRRLHCEFYECSAREGWSKQITRPNCKRAAQDTLNTAAVAATAIGVGMLGTAPPRTLCPNSQDTSDLQRSKSVQLKRYHVRSLSVGTSAETDGSVPTSPTSSRTALRPDSGASLSEDDSDESKRSFNYFGLPKSRLCLRSNSLIGKLSPRLCRKFSKMDDSRNAKKDTASKVASAKDFRKKGNSVLSGLSSSLFTASAITPESVNSDFCRRESASCCSTSTSTTGSTESLTSCSPESDGREAMIWRTAANANNNNHLPRREEKDRTVNGGRLSFCSPATCPAQLQDKESVGWEPFLQLCRDGRAHRTRVRSRSPSNFLRNGFKRIRSLAAETGSHNNHHGHKTLFGAPSIAISKSWRSVFVFILFYSFGRFVKVITRRIADFIFHVSLFRELCVFFQ